VETVGLLKAALLAHVVAQTPPVFRWDVAPARRRFVAANLPLLLPMFAHLLAHLPSFIRRQIAPIPLLRPRAANRTEQTQKE
jgi:hypothetical protein